MLGGGGGGACEGSLREGGRDRQTNGGAQGGPLRARIWWQVLDGQALGDFLRQDGAAAFPGELRVGPVHGHGAVQDQRRGLHHGVEGDRGVCWGQTLGGCLFDRLKRQVRFLLKCLGQRLRHHLQRTCGGTGHRSTMVVSLQNHSGIHDSTSCLNAAKPRHSVHAVQQGAGRQRHK